MLLPGRRYVTVWSGSKARKGEKDPDVVALVPGVSPRSRGTELLRRVELRLEPGGSGTQFAVLPGWKSWRLSECRTGRLAAGTGACKRGEDNEAPELTT
jgi:hypothetical protein